MLTSEDISGDQPPVCLNSIDLHLRLLSLLLVFATGHGEEGHEENCAKLHYYWGWGFEHKVTSLIEGGGRES